MNWFEGSIPDAIAAAKRTNAVFVVYVTGEDVASKQMDLVWDEEDVTKVCETHQCVAIKLQANSDICGHFSQIYPVVVVPSTFFIGHTGVPLEIIGGLVKSEEFVLKLTSIFQANASKNQEQIVASKPIPSPRANQNTPSAASGSLATESMPSSSTSQNEEGTQLPVDSPSQAASLEERLDRAQEKIAKKREERVHEEEQKEKTEEIKRRHTSRVMEEQKRSKLEQEAKETRAEIRKEKEDDRKAREKIKQEIERDRAEKAARYKRDKEEVQQAKDDAKRIKLEEDQRTATAEASKRSESARIQFRLVNGSSVMNKFDARDPLWVAMEFVAQHTGAETGSFSLASYYPRRTFSQEDMDQTFQELELAPSAVLMVLPAKKSGTVSSQSQPSGFGLSNMIWLLFSPLVLIWNFLTGFLGTSSSESPSPSPPPPSQQEEVTYGERTSQNQQSEQGAYRREGRLHNLRRDDDDGATWNGNSTQQL